MQTQKMKRRTVTKTTRKAMTYNVDIAQEFNDVKQTFASRMDKLDNKLDAFKDEISAWRSIFESKLTELNTNMKTMLERLAQHDFRFTEHEKRISTLEVGKVKLDTQKETISNLAQFGWWAAKALIGAGILIGGMFGAAGAWKIVFGS